jgi:hypothetical protein
MAAPVLTCYAIHIALHVGAPVVGGLREFRVLVPEMENNVGLTANQLLPLVEFWYICHGQTWRRVSTVGGNTGRRARFWAHLLVHWKDNAYDLQRWIEMVSLSLQLLILINVLISNAPPMKMVHTLPAGSVQAHPVGVAPPVPNWPAANLPAPLGGALPNPPFNWQYFIELMYFVGLNELRRYP